VRCTGYLLGICSPTSSRHARRRLRETLATQEQGVWVFLGWQPAWLCFWDYLVWTVHASFQLESRVLPFGDRVFFHDGHGVLHGSEGYDAEAELE